jgi:hypothetical protein
MTESGENYYVKLSCSTPGATILYNHNLISPGYTPTSPYGDSAVVIPKSYFADGVVTLTARAVKEGYSDAGVVTLKLTSSGAESDPADSGAAYPDVPETAWYAPAVDYVMGKNLFDLDGKNFSPNAPMTRAMLVTALYRLEGKPEIRSYADFTDITKGTPLSESVSWAFNAGITTGTGNGSTFSPNSSITREQIAAMFYRYAAYKNRSLAVQGDLSAFPDSGEISAYARDALAWANGAKIINGSAQSDGTTLILPQGTATRAQVAQILLNLAG